MRILIVVPQFPPRHLGGTELQAEKMACELASRGNHIYLITKHDEGLPTIEKIDRTFLLYRCKKVFFPVAQTLTAVILGTLKTVFSTNVDVLLAYALYPSGLVAVLAGKIARKPVIVWGRGDDVYLKTTPFVKMIKLLVLMSSDIVLAQTVDMKKHLLKTWKYIKYLVVVPNAVDLTLFNNQEREPHPSVVTYVGGLRQVKGVNYLIKALKIILKKIPDVELMIVGGGKEEEKLKTIAEDLGVANKVLWIGQVGSDDVVDYLRKSTLLVLPSLSEGFPNVILEAMACGIPIVATKVGGIPHIIKDGVNGLLVEPRDSEALAKAITLLLKKPSLREEIRRNNEHEIERYDLNKITDKIERILKEANKN